MSILFKLFRQPIVTEIVDIGPGGAVRRWQMTIFTSTQQLSKMKPAIGDTVYVMPKTVLEFWREAVVVKIAENRDVHQVN